MKKQLTATLLTAASIFAIPSASAASIYADWTVDDSGNSGSGTFNGLGGMPDFTFTITGDHNPDSTKVDDNDDFDNNLWESYFGEGDDQESLRFGRGNDVNLPISTLTINFNSPLMPSYWAFAVTDLEGEDAIIQASLGGVPVSNAEIASWLVELFDSKPDSSGSPHTPSGFDADNAAVVAEFDDDGLLDDGIFNQSGTESASAWFLPTSMIDQLTITHRNRFGGKASMHVYMAASSTPVPEPQTLGLFSLALLMVGSVYRKQKKATILEPYKHHL
ncbi:PEP-CTERM sorting domain-containing protein [Photobacterium sanctipauli]|uniref:PEP-CTERM sorting domain-containing protein n=1 Tax=Photobacterium sanctipauli TaxID=1342794 RepID=A0A2T3NN14_9GAMM|nr:PEP-CTERM sorting domain-containing protein [Photobacterium sanctipauli]PSW16853.1 PEP-CTERM sorting domain-containing protein [Photobacterium sanctipauli]